jgi:hypothetical protein
LHPSGAETRAHLNGNFDRYHEGSLFSQNLNSLTPAYQPTAYPKFKHLIALVQCDFALPGFAVLLEAETPSKSA